METWTSDDEIDMRNYTATDDQLLAMWKASGGHVLRFARMVESFYGIGQVLDDVNAS